MRWIVPLAALVALGGCRKDTPSAPAPRPAAQPACHDGPVSGRLGPETRWCGQVQVVGNVLVPRGARLTIAPGTAVRFKAYRGYRNPERRLQLRVEGRLVAQGRPGQLIRFTSDAPDPRNGDWSMVKLVEATGSKIAHAVFEFGQHGLNIWKTDIELEGVVIRFQNWEGLYAENHCRVTVRGSRIYANGYNCIAVEQYTRLRVEGSYIGPCGTLGIHVDASRAEIRGNLIEGSQEGVCLDNDARALVEGNRFAGQLNGGISCDEGDNRLRLGENDFDGTPDARAVACPAAAVKEVKGRRRPPTHLVSGVQEGPGAWLDYLPGEQRRDRYPYVYPDADETRRVTRKLGGKMGLTWSLAWDGSHLWTANLSGEIFRLDLASGRVVRRLRAPGPQPWGMTWSSDAPPTLWVNDFARRRIYALDPASGAVRRELPAPDPAGGCKGLAWDGQHLYALGWATHRLYGLDPRSGEVLSEVPVPARDLGGGVQRHVAGGLTWDGQAFWAPSDRLVRFDRQGRALGWIHSTSERVWDLTWDGTALWTTQRANENWTEYPRLFRVQVRALQR